MNEVRVNEMLEAIKEAYGVTVFITPRDGGTAMESVTRNMPFEFMVAIHSTFVLNIAQSNMYGNAIATIVCVNEQGVPRKIQFNIETGGWEIIADGWKNDTPSRFAFNIQEEEVGVVFLRAMQRYDVKGTTPMLGNIWNFEGTVDNLSRFVTNVLIGGHEDENENLQAHLRTIRNNQKR